MLDLKFIRDNKEIVKDAILKRASSFNLDALISLDDERRGLLSEVEDMRAKQNDITGKISSLEDISIRAKNIKDAKEIKEILHTKETELKEATQKWQNMMLSVPNIPDISVPEGKTEDDNKEIKSWGEKPRFSYTPKNHEDLMLNLDMVDFERGSKAHGFRGYFLKNDGAMLSWAIWNFAQEFFLKKGFTPFIAPAIVKKEYFYGTGHLPSDAEDLYKTQDDDYLSGTAEVPMMAYHANEVLKKEDLPKKYLAFSPCYRREAGSYGKDTKGLMRVNEFFKLEQLILCEASHEESVKLHEELNRNVEEFIEAICIPYRQLAICLGDLKTSQVKSYDTELWIPSQNAYREIASTSYYHDFQTRRFGIKYTDKDKRSFAHSLNGTAAPTPRILVAIVENYQKEDGSITVPEVLRKYIGKDTITKAS